MARKMARASMAMESPDLGGTLPGAKSNLWSLKARQDIFERRQNGEDWETICKDYPTRTRHAMQQQYSVMKKQNAPDSPRFVSNKRGRRTRGTTRNRWATVNRLHSSSEDGLDSDQPFDVEMDEEEEELFDSDEPAAEESSLVADEDLVAENDGAHERNARAPALGRSATEPSPSYPNLPRKATFPNLPGFAVPATPAPTAEEKAVQSEQTKRKVNGEGTDSESRSSSRISKRRKYSAEPTESVYPASADPMAPPKALSQSLNMSGMIFYPDAIAQASENFRTLSRAVLNEQASRKDTFEAALRRANRRANEAERKLQDMSQSYADKLKAKEEAHAGAVESLRAENATLSASLTSLRESFQALSEASSRRAVLDEKHAQLARLDEILPPLTTEAAKLLDVRTQALSHTAAIGSQHERLSKLIGQFLENIEEVSMKRLKGYGIEIQDESRAMGERISEAKVGWEELSGLTETFWNGFRGLIECKPNLREEKNGETEGEVIVTGAETVEGKQADEKSRKGENERAESNEMIDTRRTEEKQDKEGGEGERNEAEKTNEVEMVQSEEGRNQASDKEERRTSEELPTESATIGNADEPPQSQPMEIDGIEKQRLEKEAKPEEERKE